MIRYEQVGVEMERWSFRALDPKIRGSVWHRNGHYDCYPVRTCILNINFITA